jgi:hypothetical protein
MKKKKLSKQELIEQEEKYVTFLQKKLQSENYKANVSKEEYEKEKRKYDKQKLKVKFMKDEL